MTATILLVDDEKNIRRTLTMVLTGAGFDTQEADSAEEGLKLLETTEIDLVILDVRLPGMGGIEALEKIRANPNTERLPVLMISGHASVAEAVNAVHLGATDFFEKPLDRDRVVVSVRNALRTYQLQREIDRLKSDARSRYAMVGQSVAMQRLFSEIEKVAPTRGRVLITGESGTGKELIARAVHILSPRKDNAFIKVNCAAIPAELIESELFGYERGAFTGAQARKKGMFELANHGTLFLDEIGDMSLNAQAKVLRVLQSGEVTRVGSEASVAVDVRVLAATNKDLEAAVRSGEFREDLYFRLNVVPLRSPSLRERRDDIAELANAFAKEFFRENGMREKHIDDDVFDALTERSWPGNVRELKNVVERMLILSGDRVTIDDVPEDLRALYDAEMQRGTAPSSPGNLLTSRTDEAATRDVSARMNLRDYREKAERDYIVSTLDECEWNISRAANVLGVERTNLHKKMRGYGIRREGSVEN